MSLRDVEELLAKRGIHVTHETIRQWCRKFGPEYARRLKRREGVGGGNLVRGTMGDLNTARRRFKGRSIAGPRAGGHLARPFQACAHDDLNWST